MAGLSIKQETNLYDKTLLNMFECLVSLTIQFMQFFDKNFGTFLILFCTSLRAQYDAVCEFQFERSIINKKRDINWRNFVSKLCIIMKTSRNRATE